MRATVERKVRWLLNEGQAVAKTVLEATDLTVVLRAEVEGEALVSSSVAAYTWLLKTSSVQVELSSFELADLLAACERRSAWRSYGERLFRALGALTDNAAFEVVLKCLETQITMTSHDMRAILSRIAAHRVRGELSDS